MHLDSTAMVKLKIVVTILQINHWRWAPWNVAFKLDKTRFSCFISHLWCSNNELQQHNHSKFKLFCDANSQQIKFDVKNNAGNFLYLSSPCLNSISSRIHNDVKGKNVYTIMVRWVQDLRKNTCVCSMRVMVHIPVYLFLELSVSPLVGFSGISSLSSCLP